MKFRKYSRSARFLTFVMILSLAVQLLFVPAMTLAEENENPAEELQKNSETVGNTPAGNEEPGKPEGEEPEAPAGNEEPVVPAGNEVPEAPAGNEVPEAPAGNEVPEAPAGNEEPVVPTGNEVPEAPAGSEKPETLTAAADGAATETAPAGDAEDDADLNAAADADQDALAQAAGTDPGYAVTYDYNATLYDPDSGKYPGVYEVAIDPNSATAGTAPTIGMPSIADQNLDTPTTESPAIIQGAAVGYEIKTGPVDYTVLEERPEPQADYRVTIMEEAGQDGTVHKKLTGFDGTYVITRLDVSSFFTGVTEPGTTYLHLKQENNMALIPGCGMMDNNKAFADQLGNKTGAYLMSDLIDKSGATTDTPFIDVLIYATAANVAGADAGKANTPNGDIPLQLYMDDVADYNPSLVYDPMSTDPNHAANCLAKFFDAEKAAAAAATISRFLIKGSDLALEVSVEDSAGANRDSGTTYWSLTKAFEDSYYDLPEDQDPNDPGCGRTIKLMSEVSITDTLDLTGTDANHPKKRTLDVNSFDVQVATNTTTDTSTNPAGFVLQNAWLTLKDGTNTTGAEVAIGNNAQFVIDSGAKLIIDDTCQLEIEWDGATTQPGSAQPTTPDILNNGILDLREGGEIVNNGIITIEGTEGKPHQQGVEPDPYKGCGELTISEGAKLTNNGCLMIYGKLYNLGTLVNNGKYSDVIVSNDPDKGLYEYHKGIQISWKDDVTQPNVVPGTLFNGKDRNGKIYTGAVLENNGDIVLVPGKIENFQTLINSNLAHIYVAAAIEAIIPVEPAAQQPAGTPVITTQRIKIDPAKASVIENYGTIINNGRIEPATVEIRDNGSLGALSVPGKNADLFSLVDNGTVINNNYIYGWPSPQTQSGAWLCLYGNKTFTVLFPDGSKLTGSFDFDGDKLVFTAADGTEITPAAEDNGNMRYRFSAGSAAVEFSISADTLTRVRAAMENADANTVIRIRGEK